MTTGPVTVGRADVGAMVCTPVPLRLNWIVSEPVCALASRMACRSEPLPVSLRLVTTKTAGARRVSSASSERGGRRKDLVRAGMVARRNRRKRGRSIGALQMSVGREPGRKFLLELNVPGVRSPGILLLASLLWGA